MILKKITSFFIFIVFFLNFTSYGGFICYGEENSSKKLEGHAQFYEYNDNEVKNIFTGETHKIKTRDVIKMTVSEVLSSGFTQEGDEFFAQITEDVEGKSGVVLPVGTVAHGTVKEMEDSKRLGRDAWIEINFDYLVTPDGRQIPIEGKMSTKMHPVAGVAKTVLVDTGYTLAGGVIGGFAALNLLGIEAAIASQGYTLAGGAALGGAIGLGISLFRKGKDVLISPGDEIKVRVLTPIDLPVIADEALMVDELKLEGLDVKITNIKLEKDPFGEMNTYNLSLIIINNTEKSFSSFDLALMSDLNRVFYPSVFGDNTLLMKTIKPQDRVSGKLSFAVDNPKNNHWLVFFDRRTRKPVAKISINNAIRLAKQKEREKKNN